MRWWPWKRRKEAIAAQVAQTASAAIAALPVDPLTQHVSPAAIVSTVAEACIQGYAPSVKVSRRRHGTKCKCGRKVLRDVRHICIYNAEHHIESLTREERAQLIDELRALGITTCIHDWCPMGWHRWICTVCEKVR